MWHIARKMQRRSWRSSAKFGRLTLTGWLAGTVVVFSLIAMWALDQKGASAADRHLADLAREADRDPVETVAQAARGNRLVFLSDIPNSVVTKQFAVRAITRIASTSGLDAVILEIGADQQPYLDQYFDRPVEDAAVLLARPATTGNPSTARAYLEIYRAIWKLNHTLGADRRIRVIAADLPGGASPGAMSPAVAAQRMGRREAHMKQQIDPVLSAIPGARVLIFAGGLHALKSGTITLQTGGTAPVNVKPLAALFAATAEETYTILVDAPGASASARDIAPYNGTRVAEVLAAQGVRNSFGMRVTAAFDHLRQPILKKQTPGIEFDIEPRDYKLRDVADAYVNLGR